MPITAPVVVFAPSSPTDSTSPDGHIRAIVDDANAGVTLIVDYSLSDVTLSQDLSTPFACTVYRQDPDGTISRVRGGDPYKNFGGRGTLYDQEGPLASLATYWVVPVMADGTDGPPCAGVQVQTALDPVPDMWLISPYDANASLNVNTSDSRKGSYSTRTDLQNVLGAQMATAVLETSSGLTTSMTLLTTTQDEFKAAKKLFTLKVIFRKSSSWERQDAWFTVGDVSFEAAVSTIGAGYFWWTVALSERDRPATAGQFVSIPGRTLKDRKAKYPLFSDVIKRQFCGNLLLEDDSEFDSVVSWAAGSNTTVSQDVVNFRKGTGSMKLVATAAGNVSALAPYNVPVDAGKTYEITAWVFNPQGGRTTSFEVDWKDSANHYLGFSASTATYLSALQWTFVKFRATVPTGVTYATLIAQGIATHAADSFSFDIVSIGPAR